MTNGKKIFLIEKDIATRELVLMRLAARHHKVHVETNSLQALKFLDKETPDLILLSSDMELVGGKRLIQIIRTRSHLVATPVIMIARNEQLTELMLGHERGFDDFLVRPISPLVLQLRVSLNIIKVSERVEANTLTRLPGNHAIEKMVAKKIAAKEKFSILYIDINHFKAFNDYYSFKKGDEAILQTARLLISTARAIAREESSFIGHIGGDDFIVVLSPEYEEVFARQFIDDFDRIIPTYYSKKDRERGFIRVENRRGELENFPIMSCAVAGCTNLYNNYQSFREMARDVAEVKSYLKTQPGSHYLQDRRSAPIKQIEEAMHILTPEISHKKKHKKPDPLGQMLLNAGLITEEQLAEALCEHLESGQRFGQTLIRLKMVSSEDVGKMLGQKLKVPYFNLSEYPLSDAASHLFDMDFIQRHRVVPIDIEGGSFRVAMCDPFDIKTLDAMERICGLKPVPLLMLEGEFENFLENSKAHMEKDSAESFEEK